MTKSFTPLAAALIFCGISLAAPASAAPSRIVHYGDLDLGSPAGQQALSDRLRSAVRNVCDTPNPLDARAMMEHRRCRRAASEVAGQRAEQAIAAYRTGERLAARR